MLFSDSKAFYTYLFYVYLVSALVFVFIGGVSAYFSDGGLISVLVGAVTGWVFLTSIAVSLVFASAFLFLGYIAVRFLLETLR